MEYCGRRCKNHKRIIASDIAVHNEHLQELGIYFSPKNEVELAENIMDTSNWKLEVRRYNYESNFLKFGLNFMKLLKSAIWFRMVLKKEENIKTICLKWHQKISIKYP